MGPGDQFEEGSSKDVLFVKTPEGLKEVCRKPDAETEQREHRVAMRVGLVCGAVSFGLWLYYFVHQFPIVHTLFTRATLDLSTVPPAVQVLLVITLGLRAVMASVPVVLVVYLVVSFRFFLRRVDTKALGEASKPKK